ncbi:short-chain dehydrogenase/reductase SDR [Thermobaculum terrenum ATCC BAA-798]|uniref:Short-chain dehydrogenase/reductase SDR n=1 Tax=Thermobaculum terrenum (strain ATCC BAA-798 / CCMEE 7001 / YNP1) TaxID=525904 RepID=D1CC44_THET1|nr:SDR family oxidoreductase [Thermobaculum terrenum]ACZ42359.1 short-chain dehydrogenase/reductase SDR [Thermobaculum terrenum ATCC BAA-798]
MTVASKDYLYELFNLEGKVALVTGSTGVLGGAMAHGLARAGARVGIIGRREAKAKEVADSIQAEGGTSMALPADVLRQDQLIEIRNRVLQEWGRIDILVNAAGGNVPDAFVPPQGSIFDVPIEATRRVVDLNFYGTILPTMVFGEAMVRGEHVQQPSGCIVNISSMAALRAITRTMGYSAAKAAVTNFTQWLAVELAHKFGEGVRVNAIAPGFFLGEQNRSVLINSDGNPTPRGKLIINRTPLGRFGRPEELITTLLWLCSPASSFVTGVVVPVDGGFSAFSGV